MSNLLNYQKIDSLFGAPLNTVLKPQVPFKLKTWHVLVGGAVIGLMAYGAYALHRDHLKKFMPKIKKEE